ncbi:MAG: hypothetical protein RLZZ568_766 [Cyanobacteriota bacterium]
MRFHQSCSVNLSKNYPCPCRRRGRLIPIVLTEALGCDRCQQIFIVHEDQRAIEQLATVYPSRRLWRWTGSRWQLKKNHIPGQQWPGIVALLLTVFIGWSFLALYSPLILSIILGIAIAAALVFFLIYSFWLSYRR